MPSPHALDVASKENEIENSQVYEKCLHDDKAPQCVVHLGENLPRTLTTHDRPAWEYICVFTLRVSAHATVAPVNNMLKIPCAYVGACLASRPMCVCRAVDFNKTCARYLSVVGILSTPRACIGHFCTRLTHQTRVLVAMLDRSIFYMHSLEDRDMFVQNNIVAGHRLIS